MPRPLFIAGVAYGSKLAAIREASRILNAGPPGSPVEGEDINFVEALLSARADKTLDLHGLNPVRYERDWQDQRIATQRWTLCFWAVLEDGTRVDFSFMKAIDDLAEARSHSIA